MKNCKNYGKVNFLVYTEGKMGKMRNGVKNIVNGKVVVGIMLAWSLSWTWEAIANTLKGKEEIRKVYVVDKEEKGNTEENKTIDFQEAQQAKKVWEKQREDMPQILRGSKKMEQYLSSHDRVAPFLKNWTKITTTQLVDSLPNPYGERTRMFSFVEINDKIYLSLDNPPYAVSIVEGSGAKRINENTFEISGEVVFLIQDKLTWNDGLRGIAVWKKFAVANDIINDDKPIIVDAVDPEEWNFGLNTRLKITEGENTPNWLSYIGEDSKYHALAVAEDPDQTVAEIEISKLFELLEKQAWVKKDVAEENWIRETKYQIGIECGTESEYFPNFHTRPYTLIKREKIWEYCAVTIEKLQWVEDAYLVNENGVKIKDITHINKGIKVKLVANSKEEWKIDKMSMNGEVIKFEEQADGSAISKNFLTISEKNITFQIGAISTSGINWTEVKEPRISSENGTLTIDTQDTLLQSVQIYDHQGQLIAQKSKPEWVENFHLSQGLYLVKWRTVKGESKTVKIMLK